MKKILFLFLLIPALAQAQRSVQLPVEHFDGEVYAGVIDTAIFWNDGTPHFGIGTWGQAYSTSYQFRIPDCEPWEKFTEWQAKNAGKPKCAHDWVVAEWREVNGINLIHTSEIPPPCGKTSTENEARICRACLRHETRVRMHGMKEAVRKSEFQTLLEKINDR